MSVTTTEPESGSKPDTAKLNLPTSASAAAVTNPADASGQADAFDAESLEISFGLPPGSLKDVKDEAGVIDAVRTMTDKILAAGVGFTPTSADPEVNAAKGAAKPAEKKVETKVDDTKPSGNAELDALRAKVDKLESRDAERVQQTQQSMKAELDRRIGAKLDSWASPKYGVSGTRNYAQTKAVREFKETLIPNLLSGRQAAGLPIDSTIEVYMEQLRVFDDTDYKPTKKAADKSAALGTPGAAKGAGKEADAPQSIHHALMRNPN